MYRQHVTSMLFYLSFFLSFFFFLFISIFLFRSFCFGLSISIFPICLSNHIEQHMIHCYAIIITSFSLSPSTAKPASEGPANMPYPAQTIKIDFQGLESSMFFDLLEKYQPSFECFPRHHHTGQDHANHHHLDRWIVGGQNHRQVQQGPADQQRHSEPPGVETEAEDQEANSLHQLVLLLFAPAWNLQSWLWFKSLTLQNTFNTGALFLFIVSS